MVVVSNNLKHVIERLDKLYGDINRIFAILLPIQKFKKIMTKGFPWNIKQKLVQILQRVMTIFLAQTTICIEK